MLLDAVWCTLALVRGRLTLPPLQVRAQWEPEMQARIRSATDDAVTASEVAAAEAARLREELTQLRAESRDSNRRDASLASAALTSQVATLREESRRIRAESAAAAQESAGRILDLTTQVERLADENERLRVRVRRAAVHAWLPPGAFSPCCAWPAFAVGVHGGVQAHGAGRICDTGAPAVVFLRPHGVCSCGSC